MKMRSRITLFAGFMLLVLLSGCTMGSSSIGQNENLAVIFGSGARGAGGAAPPEGAEGDDPVDSLPMQSSPGDAVTFYKLMPGVSVSVEAGTYTIADGDGKCTISVIGANGEALETVMISGAFDEKSTGQKAVRVTVPEGGSLISNGGTCVAQKN